MKEVKKRNTLVKCVEVKLQVQQVLPPALAQKVQLKNTNLLCKWKYIPIIQKINESIDKFNESLTESFRVNKLDSTYIGNKDLFLDLRNKSWGDYSFPTCREQGGVYFYFGFDKDDPNLKKLYIGKATYGSTIGKRLWTHFYPMKQEKLNNTLYYTKGNTCIELITGIAFDSFENLFLASALEEFLITRLNNEDFTLINLIGN